MRTLSRLLLAVYLVAMGASCGRRGPIVLEADTFGGVSADPNYGVSAAQGWAAYDESSYSRGRAAITRAGDATMQTTVAGLSDETSYRVEVIVLNFAGPGQNAFELSVGGVRKTLTFGGSTVPAGLLRLGELHFRAVESDEIRIRAISVGQTYLIIDTVRLYPHDEDEPMAVTEWERPVSRIGSQICHNCVEGESLRPMDHAADYGRTSGAGWASYAEGSYSGGRAAITRLPGAIMSGRIPRLMAGRMYRVTLSVASFNVERNEVDLQLGEQTKRITFGGPAFPIGVSLLQNVIFEGISSDLLIVRAAAIGQPYLVVDAISLEPLAGAPVATDELWSAAEIDPIQEICTICLEAETLGGISADPNYGQTASAGWGSYEQDVYSSKRAALTRSPGALMTGKIPSFQPGPYVASVAVLSYDPAKRNSFELTLGSETRTVTFGPGREAGLIRIRNIAFSNVTTPDLRVRATEVGQPYLVIDRIALRRGKPTS